MPDKAYKGGLSREDAKASAMRSSARWRRVRALVGKLCADPLERTSARAGSSVAEDVHHIVPIAERPDLAYERSNLMPVCRSCHKLMERHTNEIRW